MNNLKTIKALTKLATKLDQRGYHQEANFVDSILEKMAGNLTPVGNVYQENGKFYRRFEDSSIGLVVKEVSPSGELLGAPAPKAPVEPISQKPPEPSTSLFDTYNPFPDLASAIRGYVFPEPTPAAEKPLTVEKDLPKTNPAKDKKDKKTQVEDYLSQVKDLAGKLKDLGWRPGQNPDEEETEIMLDPFDPLEEQTQFMLSPIEVKSLDPDEDTEISDVLEIDLPDPSWTDFDELTGRFDELEIPKSEYDKTEPTKSLKII